MRRGFKSWSEEQALVYRKALSLKKYEPMPAETLASYLKVKLVNPRQIPNISEKILDLLLSKGKSSWSAATFGTKKSQIIVFNPTHSEYRHESTIMHELAHYLCEHEPAKLVNKSVCSFPFRSYNKAHEDEANWFAGSLKLPRPALIWALSKEMTINECSLHFGASEELVKYRKNVTGVTRQLNARKKFYSF